MEEQLIDGTTLELVTVVMGGSTYMLKDIVLVRVGSGCEV